MAIYFQKKLIAGDNINVTSEGLISIDSEGVITADTAQDISATKTFVDGAKLAFNPQDNSNIDISASSNTYSNTLALKAGNTTGTTPGSTEIDLLYNYNTGRQVLMPSVNATDTSGVELGREGNMFRKLWLYGTITDNTNAITVAQMAAKSTVSGANDGTNWTSITIDGVTKTIPSGASGSYLPLSGGTMTGDIDMGHNEISNVLGIGSKSGNSITVTSINGTDGLWNSYLQIYGGNSSNLGYFKFNVKSGVDAAGKEFSGNSNGYLNWADSVVIYSPELTEQYRDDIRTIINNYGKYNCMYIFPRVKFRITDSPTGAIETWSLTVWAQNSTYMTIKASQCYGYTESISMYSSAQWNDWKTITYA